MNSDEIKEEVVRLGSHTPKRGIVAETGWYQEFDLDGIKTHKGNPLANDEVSNAVLSLLPPSLSGSRILDVCANAGMHSVRCALRGASVVSIENKPWFIEQSRFIKKFFEEKYGQINWTILNKDLVGNLTVLGEFDAILAIGAIPFINTGLSTRYSRKAEEIRRKIAIELSTMTLHIIVSYGSNGYHTEWYNKFLFGSVGFFEYAKVKTEILTISSFRKCRRSDI